MLSNLKRTATRSLSEEDMAMDTTWLRVLIASEIMIALLSLGALEAVSSRVPTDHSFVMVGLSHLSGNR